MALDIFLSEGKHKPVIKERYFISFDDDPYYWHLYSVFKKVAEVTGIMIDLYSDVEFRDFTVLKSALQDEFLISESREGSSWRINAGTLLGPTKKEIWVTVEKEKLCKLLKRFLEMIEVAENNNYRIVCVGD